MLGNRNGIQLRNKDKALQMVKKIGCILLISILCSCMREAEIVFPDTPLGNMEALWHTIDTKYCFIDEKGIDWADIREEYHAKAAALPADDERALFDLLAGMLDSLHDGHVNLYSPFDVSRNRTWYEGYPANYNAAIVYGGRYLTSGYKTAGGIRYNRIADGKIGLIRYESFQDGFSALNMAYVLQYFKDCRGLIVDVRSNGGGSLEYARRLAAVFFSESRTVGYWSHKTGEAHNAFSPLESMIIDTADMPVRWLRPTVVLCNRTSYSATNFFVSAMRYADNALLIGGTTGGGGGMPMSYELPNGWTVRFSSIKMYDADKHSIEEGIEPHVPLNLETGDTDNIIEYAINLLLQ